MYFWTYGLRNTWLGKCLKSPVWKDPSKSNTVNGPKHCSKLEESTFTIFIDFCEGNSGLESPVSENPSKSNIANAWNTVEIWKTVPLPYLLISVKKIRVKKLYLTDMQNLRTVCYPIYCRWQVFSSQQKQFIAKLSDAIISETKNFCWFFFLAVSIFRIIFEHFEEKDDPDRWCIFELTDSEKCG